MSDPLTAHDYTLPTSSKILLLIRHAKSSWDSSIASDFERPLNDRGKRDAPIMAGRLKNKKIIPNTFISSPAARAFATARIFCDVYGVSQKQIVTVPALYHAPPETFFDVIRSLDDVHNTVAIFSHNPGITGFANMLTELVTIDNIPTCGIFGVQVFTAHWTNFNTAQKALLLFDYPKNT